MARKKRKPITIDAAPLEPPSITPEANVEEAKQSALAGIGAAASGLASYGVAVLVFLGLFFLAAFDDED